MLSRRDFTFKWMVGAVAGLFGMGRASRADGFLPRPINAEPVTAIFGGRTGGKREGMTARGGEKIAAFNGVDSIPVGGGLMFDGLFVIRLRDSMEGARTGEEYRYVVRPETPMPFAEKVAFAAKFLSAGFCPEAAAIEIQGYATERDGVIDPVVFIMEFRRRHFTVMVPCPGVAYDYAPYGSFGSFQNATELFPWPDTVTSA